MVNFWYNMDIYDTNKESIKIEIMVTHCEDIPSSLHYNSANTQDKRLKIKSRILLKDKHTKYGEI